jgi:pyruvate dehydrogenase E2 component (dihydrolipoamide acetyltransferase)
LSLAARTAARRLQESKQTVPHFYLQTSANAEALLARRAAALPLKLAWDAFFVWAVNRALKAFPKLACRFENEQLLPQESDSIGVAVDLDGDLYVVAVAAAAGQTLEQISAALRTAVESLRRNDSGARCRTRNVMTITNLGMTGVEAFAAIINPPEAAILAIGKVAPVVVAVDGRPVVQNRVTLTLSVDHRVASGKYAAEFLQHLVAELEAV